MILRTCSSCGTTNRIPAGHLADTGRCGKCKAAIPPLDTPIDADSATFEAVIRDARVPVLVDFWAAWCGPCRMAAPEVASVAREMAGNAVVLKVDTERQPDLAARFQVRSIPYFMVFDGGRPAMQRPGLARATEMRNWLHSATAQPR